MECLSLLEKIGKKLNVSNILLYNSYRKFSKAQSTIWKCFRTFPPKRLSDTVFLEFWEWNWLNGRCCLVFVGRKLNSVTLKVVPVIFHSLGPTLCSVWDGGSNEEISYLLLHKLVFYFSMFGFQGK